MAYTQINQYEKAVEFNQESLSIFQQIGDKFGEFKSLYGLGLTYRAMGQEQKAREFFEQSEAIKREIGID